TSASCLFSYAHARATELYLLSLHDALPIWSAASLFAPTLIPSTPARFAGTRGRAAARPPLLNPSRLITAWSRASRKMRGRGLPRSEEHTSELQSRGHLVCRLLLEKKKSVLI